MTTEHKIDIMRAYASLDAVAKAFVDGYLTRLIQMSGTSNGDTDNPAV